MTAANIARDAILGNPPDPDKQPDPEGVVNAFVQVDTDVALVQSNLDDAVEDLTALISTGALDVNPVACATTANITLSGEQTIDGVLTNLSRVLVKDQTTPAANGIYDTKPGAWTRVAEMNAADEVPGVKVFVLGGTVNGKTNFTCTTRAPVTLGTTPITWVISGKSPDVVSSLSAGAAVIDPATTQIVLLNGAGTAPLRISWTNLLAKINEDAMGPPTYVWPAHRVVRTTAIELIPLDAGLQRFDIINTSDAVAYIAEGGIPATIGGFGSVAIPPKGIYTTDFALPGAVSAISTGEVLLTVKFKTTTNYNVAARATAKEYTDKVAEIWGGTLSAAQITVLQDFYSSLYSAGVLSTTGVMYNLLAPGLATNINLCDLQGPRANTVGSITRTNWRSMAFDGTSAYLDTQRFMSEIARDIDHSAFVYPASNALQGSSRVAIGDATILVTPNRTSTTVAGRSSSSTLLTASGFSVNPALLSMSRVDSAKATFRQGLSTKVDVTDAVTLPIQTRHILVGARNTGPIGGAVEIAAGSYYSGPMVLAGAGRSLSDAAHAAIHNATAKLILDASAF